MRLLPLKLSHQPTPNLGIPSDGKVWTGLGQLTAMQLGFSLDLIGQSGLWSAQHDSNVRPTP